MVRLQGLVLRPPSSRSVVFRLPSTYPTSIAHTLAVMSHISRHIPHQRSRVEGTDSEENQDGSPPLQIERADMARDVWQRSMLNYGFLQFTSSTHAQAALEISRENLRLRLPPISPISSSFVFPPGPTVGKKAESVSRQKETPLKRLLRLSAPATPPPLSPSTVEKVEYAGLTDVAPFLGLRLPASITGIAEGGEKQKEDDENEDDEAVARWREVQTDENVQWTQIVLHRRDRFKPSDSDAQRTDKWNDDLEFPSRRATSAFKTWQGFSHLKARAEAKNSQAQQSAGQEG